MEEYKPKRFEFRRNGNFNYAVGLSLATERYGMIQDFYIFANFWWFSITIVFLRMHY